MKIKLTVLALIAALCLSGCALYDEAAGNDISKFVKPDENAILEVIPDESDVAPSPADTVEDQQETELTPFEEQELLMSTAESVPGAFVLDAPIFTEDGYLNCGTFKFKVPVLWQDRILVEVIAEDNYGHIVTDYYFYYVQQEPRVNALMMNIRVVPFEYFYDYGVRDGINILSNESTDTEYFLMKQEEETLPEEFTEMDIYSAIYSGLATMEDPIEIR